MMNKINLCKLCFCLSLISSCNLFEKKQDTPLSGEKKNETITPQKSYIALKPRVQQLDIEPGEGVKATIGDQLTVHYRAFLESGELIDDSRRRGAPYTFNLGDGIVIKGWEKGILGMRKGGKRKIIVPPALAYGSDGLSEVVPPNESIIFEIELLTIAKAYR